MDQGTLFIERSLIFLSDSPIQTETPKSGLVDSLIYGGGIAPRLFRRRRLKRFAAVGEALAAARTTYRWKRAHPAPTPSLVLTHPGTVT